jgi:hypothetical protein
VFIEWREPQVAHIQRIGGEAVPREQSRVAAMPGAEVDNVRAAGIGEHLRGGYHARQPYPLIVAAGCVVASAATLAGQAPWTNSSR